MNFLTDIIFLRFLERIIIVIAAIFIVRQGVALLRDNVGNTSNVEFKGLGARFKITNAATGLVMALFGTFILGYALLNKLEIKEPAAKGDHEILTKIQSDIEHLGDKGVVSKTDLKALEDNIKDDIKKGKTNSRGESGLEIKYAQGSAGQYTGPKIQAETVRKLFDLIKKLETPPVAIDQDRLSDLKDVYREIFEFNRDNKALKDYNPDKLN